MANIIIGEPVQSIDGEGCSVTSNLRIDDRDYQIKYRVSNGSVSHTADAFLTAGLYPAMLAGGDLKIEGSVSARLLGTTGKIQDIIKSWFPEYSAISLEAETTHNGGSNDQREVGAFFSGGIDSFYSLLKHRDEIKTVIFMHGFDIPLDNHVFRERMSKSIRAVTSEFGKDLVEVETNLPELMARISPRLIPAGGDAFGAVLASIALLLSPRLKKVYIPSGYPYYDLHPWGSHVLLDPLWSTEDVEIVHDGCEAIRVEKAALVAQSEIALKNLRVCFFKPEEGINCGKCEKCMRTMAILRVVGALDRCETFTKELDLGALAETNLPDKGRCQNYQDVLQAVKEKGDDPEFAKALRECINNFKYKEIAKELDEEMVPFFESAAGERILKSRGNTFLKYIWQSDSRWMTREVLKENLKLIDQKLFKGFIYKLWQK